MRLYKDYTDEQLLELLKDKNSDAFAEMYNRHWEKLIETGYYFTRDKQAVEEIVNDIFIRLWKRPEGFQIRSLEDYLSVAVKFGVFKSLDKAKRRKMLLKSYTMPVYTYEEEEQMEARFMATYLNEVIETLPEKSKAIFRYSREEYMTIADISKEMNMQPKAVEYHITKSLKKLRKALHALNVTHVFVLVAGMWSRFF